MHFVNCDNHSLNLAGVYAASQDPVTVIFFGTVESIYCFFRSINPAMGATEASCDNNGKARVTNEMECQS